MTDEGYPQPICLELADLKEAEGFEKQVLEALQSFSDKQKHRARCPHDLKKEGGEKIFFKEIRQGKRTYKFDKVWSLDLVGRHDKWRMIYALDELRGVYKILSFRHDTH